MMKRVLLLCCVGCLIIFSACDNELGEDLPLLKGQVGGEAWTFKMGKALRGAFSDELDVSFYSQSELGNDPCAIGNSNNNHLTITIPNSLGNFNLPRNGESLVFQQAGSLSSFQAASGVIEITQLTGIRGIGYLQATFDDGNTVEGRFEFDVCN